MSTLLRGARPFLVALALTAAPVAAIAATSGSFTITVIIPPFAAGIEAAKTGAVGLSTLDQPGGGLLVSTPDQVAEGSSGKVEVFSQVGTPVTLRVADGGPSGAPSELAAVNGGEATPFNGMVRNSFTIVPASGSIGQGEDAPIVSVVVASL